MQAIQTRNQSKLLRQPKKQPRNNTRSTQQREPPQTHRSNIKVRTRCQSVIRSTLELKRHYSSRLHQVHQRNLVLRASTYSTYSTLPTLELHGLDRRTKLPQIPPNVTTVLHVNTTSSGHASDENIRNTKPQSIITEPSSSQLLTERKQNFGFTRSKR